MSVRESERQLSSKGRFCRFLKVNWSNFSLRRFEEPWGCQRCQGNWVCGGGLGRVGVGGGFRGQSVAGSFASAGGVFVFPAVLGAGLSFDGVWTLS